jgi:hypothetical protein
MVHHANDIEAATATNIRHNLAEDAERMPLADPTAGGQGLP